jgi:uncharacterized damage-inducible protein DinB
MKKIIVIALVLVSNSMSSQQFVIDTFVEKWDNSKVYLVQMAEAMPEDKYDFKPSEREMSFREQVFHILQNMDWLSTTHFSKEKYNKNDFSSIKTKAQLISQISTSFDLAKANIIQNKNIDLSEKVDFFAGPKSKLQILNLMQDHATHHRGQLIVYLNLCQIQPPKYVGW